MWKVKALWISSCHKPTMEFKFLCNAMSRVFNTNFKWASRQWETLREEPRKTTLDRMIHFSHLTNKVHKTTTTKKARSRIPTQHSPTTSSVGSVRTKYNWLFQVTCCWEIIKVGNKDWFSSIWNVDFDFHLFPNNYTSPYFSNTVRSYLV